MKDDLDLSRRERQVMQVLHRVGKATATEIQAELPDPPTNSAVRSILRILEQKGRIGYERRGREYLWSVRGSSRTASRSALSRVVETYFQGSTKRAVASLLEGSAGELDADELDELAALIERAREEGR